QQVSRYPPQREARQVRPPPHLAGDRVRGAPDEAPRHPPGAQGLSGTPRVLRRHVLLHARPDRAPPADHKRQLQ
ncbi:unnamed protein product, partial [Ectocarpus sp. 8 AP-2014]